VGQPSPANARSASQSVTHATRRNVAYLTAALQEHFRWIGQDRGTAEADATRFLRAFAGTTLIIPTAAELKVIDNERRIRETLDRDPSAGAVKRVAEILGIEEKHVGKIYRKLAGVSVTARQRELAATPNV
jgi:hypothetical protein